MKIYSQEFSPGMVRIVKQYLQAILVSALFIFLGASNTLAETPPPGEKVESFHATLIQMMQNADRLGFEGRYEIIAPVIDQSFDTPLIVQVILSRYWGELDESQQQNFIQLFDRLSASTYASRFNSYSGEKFTTTGVEELKKGRMLVKTELIKSDGSKVNFDYLLHQKDGNWYIISVIANGVNDLSLKRAEYASIISERGFESLVQEIKKKISELGGPASSS